MRPVNLIPPEERRGSGAPTRTGRAPYIVLAALGAVVVVAALMTTLNGAITDKEAEIAALEVEKQNAAAKAEALAPYAQFAAARELRDVTIDSLARSRFDWNRVLDELSRVMPEDIWLTSMAGTVMPQVTIEGAPSLSIRADVPGPALELIGCGRSQESVAGFLAALRDIDGVTRVTASSSKRPEPTGSDSGANPAIPTTQGAADGCVSSSDEVSEFEIVAAFDEVAVPSTEGAAPAPAPAPPAPESAPPSGSAPAAEPVSAESGGTS